MSYFKEILYSKPGNVEIWKCLGLKMESSDTADKINRRTKDGFKNHLKEGNDEGLS